MSSRLYRMRNKLRPMRPKPIKPTFVVISSSTFSFPVLGSSKFFRTDCRVVADGGVSAVSKFKDDRGLVGIIRLLRSTRRRTERAWTRDQLSQYKLSDNMRYVNCATRSNPKRLLSECRRRFVMTPTHGRRSLIQPLVIYESVDLLTACPSSRSLRCRPGAWRTVCPLLGSWGGCGGCGACGVAM